MTAQNSANRANPVHPALACLFSLLLLISCVGLLLSLYTCLVGGPPWIPRVTILSVLLALPGCIFVFIKNREPAGPEGLSGAFPWVRIGAGPLTRAAQVVAVAWVIAWPTFFILSFIPGGIESGPVFASREKYELVNHGKRTEISRLRYCIVGTSQFVAFHTTGMALFLLALCSFLFGDPFARWPPLSVRSNSDEPSASADGVRNPSPESTVSQRGRCC